MIGELADLHLVMVLGDVSGNGAPVSACPIKRILFREIEAILVAILRTIINHKFYILI